MSDEKILVYFWSDFSNLLRNELQTAGYDTNPSDTPDTIVIKWLNVLKRRIEPKPRKICMAQGFSCPLDLNPGLEILKAKIETGEDLNFYI